MLCYQPPQLQALPNSTKPLYRLHQRLHTPKGIGQVIGIQECPGPEGMLWHYRLSGVPDQKSAWEPTWWSEEQLWPAPDLFLISIERPEAEDPHQTFYSTIEEMIEGFQKIAQEMLETGESWKITLERPELSLGESGADLNNVATTDGGSRTTDQGDLISYSSTGGGSIGAQRNKSEILKFISESTRKLSENTRLLEESIESDNRRRQVYRKQLRDACQVLKDLTARQ